MKCTCKYTNRCPINPSCFLFYFELLTSCHFTSCPCTSLVPLIIHTCFKWLTCILSWLLSSSARMSLFVLMWSSLFSIFKVLSLWLLIELCSLFFVDMFAHLLPWSLGLIWTDYLCMPVRLLSSRLCLSESFSASDPPTCPEMLLTQAERDVY